MITGTPGFTGKAERAIKDQYGGVVDEIIAEGVVVVLHKGVAAAAQFSKAVADRQPCGSSQNDGS